MLSYRTGLHGLGCTFILLWEKERIKKCFLLFPGWGSSSLGNFAAFLLVLEGAYTDSWTSYHPGASLWVWEEFEIKFETEAVYRPKGSYSLLLKYHLNVQVLTLHNYPHCPDPQPTIICSGVGALKTSPSPFFRTASKTFHEPLLFPVPWQLHTLLHHCQPHDYDFLLLMEALIKKPSFLCLCVQRPQLRTYSFGRRIYSFGRRIYPFVRTVKKSYRRPCMLNEYNFSSYQRANI